jgi:hypothetical protein
MGYLGRVAQALNFNFERVSVTFSDRCASEFRSSIGHYSSPFGRGLSSNAPPLKRIKNEAPQVQNRNSERIFESKISPRSGDDLAEYKRASKVNSLSLFGRIAFISA